MRPAAQTDAELIDWYTTFVDYPYPEFAAQAHVALRGRDAPGPQTSAERGKIIDLAESMRAEAEPVPEIGQL
jgi:hypothetical protein